MPGSMRSRITRFGSARFDDRASPAAVLGLERLEPLALEVADDHVPGRRVVVDDQHGLRPCASRISPAPRERVPGGAAPAGTPRRPQRIPQWILITGHTKLLTMPMSVAAPPAIAASDLRLAVEVAADVRVVRRHGGVVVRERRGRAPSTGRRCSRGRRGRRSPRCRLHAEELVDRVEARRRRACPGSGPSASRPSGTASRRRRTPGRRRPRLPPHPRPTPRPPARCRPRAP